MANTKEINDVLFYSYYSTKSPVAFSGIRKLYNFAKTKIRNLKLSYVKKWLEKQPAHTLHKPVKTVFTRNKIFVMRANEQWECDLVDMRFFANRNQHYKYILTAIDVFSKFAYAVPLKRKSAKTIMNALKKCFQNNVPEKLRSDKGGEFSNQVISRFLRKNNIHQFFAEGSVKCAVIERFNRTLKNRMYKYFTANNTRKYVDVLPELIDGYNNSFHRSIKMNPNDVNKQNEKIVFTNLYKNHLQPRKANTFNIGDRVRILSGPGLFRFSKRSFVKNWSEQIFEISNIIDRPQAFMYILKSRNGQTLSRRYHEEELALVSDETIERIREVVDTKILNKKRKNLVKLHGRPSSELL